MNQILGFAALVGLLLSLTAHLSALLGADVSTRFPQVWLLHIGIFVLLVPLLLSSRKTFGAKSSLTALRAAFPQWILVLGSILVGYALLNFLLFLIATQGGSPSESGGRFILQSHGHFIRELSSPEYTALRANEVRGFSGHWLVFYFWAFAYFLFRRPLEV